MRWFRQRVDLPLERGERVLDRAALRPGGELVATTLGVWLPGPRRVGWHLVSKAVWDSGSLTVIEAEEVETVDGAVVLRDLPPVRLTLTDPGRLPDVVHKRVTGSIVSRHRRELPGGGAWFVQRRVPGVDGLVLQVRPDPGTDPDVVRDIAGAAATRLRPPHPL